MVADDSLHWGKPLHPPHESAARAALLGDTTAQKTQAEWDALTASVTELLAEAELYRQDGKLCAGSQVLHATCTYSSVIQLASEAACRKPLIDASVRSSSP